MTQAAEFLRRFPDDALENLSSEELASCARLLALSIAHHRAKFGVIPLSSTLAEMDRSGPNPTAPGFLRVAGGTLREAMLMMHDALPGSPPAVVPAAAAAAPGSDSTVGEDKRHQIRIRVNAPIQVADANGDNAVPASLRNISWGGAAFVCDQPPATIGENLFVLVPEGRGRHIRILASVLRESEADGKRELGVRFESLDPADERRLLSVLKLLMSAPDHDDKRGEARLVQRLEVEYGDAGEFRATLEDISAGGMMLLVPDPLEVDQSLAVDLCSIDTKLTLTLRARVVHQTLVEECGIEMYRVGLKFEHPSPRLRDHVAAVIQELAILRPEPLPDELDEPFEATS